MSTKSTKSAVATKSTTKSTKVSKLPVLTRQQMAAHKAWKTIRANKAAALLAAAKPSKRGVKKAA